MHSVRDLSCEAPPTTLSHDELMLKELERRDGIYSFIFHELEAPKATSPLPPEANSHQQQLPCASANSAAAAAAAVSTPTVVTTTTSVITSAIAPSGAAGAAATCTFPQHYHEFLKAWHPPPALVYNHPRLYAYMANCGFRVRVPTPRFSHLSAPLVRNRRHVLKEAPDYKSCSSAAAAGLCIFKIPDLRALFPLDPDVHAPFGSGSGGGVGGGGESGNNDCDSASSANGAALNSAVFENISKC